MQCKDVLKILKAHNYITQHQYCKSETLSDYTNYHNT